MRRVTIQHEVVTEATADAFVAPDGTMFRCVGAGDGLDQLADAARAEGARTGARVVFLEVFWPWETEDMQSWDAVRCDLDLLAAGDPQWVTTLPPYAELSVQQRAELGIGGDDAQSA